MTWIQVEKISSKRLRHQRFHCWVEGEGSVVPAREQSVVQGNGGHWSCRWRRWTRSRFQRGGSCTGRQPGPWTQPLPCPEAWLTSDGRPSPNGPRKAHARVQPIGSVLPGRTGTVGSSGNGHAPEPRPPSSSQLRPPPVAGAPVGKRCNWSWQFG